MCQPGTMMTAGSFLAQIMMLATPSAHAQVPVQQVQGRANTPWFNLPGIQQYLSLNPQQFDRLMQTYDQYWTKFQGDLGNLSPAEQARQLQTLQQKFYRDFSLASADVLDPQQQQRFQQLYLQYQGYNAFNNPQVQSALKMTPEQIRRIQIIQNEYQRQLAPLINQYANNPRGTLVQYQRLREQMDAQLLAMLTQDQRLLWTQLLGQQFSFPPPFGVQQQAP